MAAFDVGELQCPGDRVEHALRGSAKVTTLELGVVVHAHPGELGNLLAPQARHTAFPTVIG